MKLLSGAYFSSRAGDLARCPSRLPGAAVQILDTTAVTGALLRIAHRDLVSQPRVFAAGLGSLFIPATILGVLALALSSGAGALLASVPRRALMGVAYLGYFAAIVALSLAVSAFARSGRVALVSLLGFWIFNCLIAPRAAADVAKAVYPTPSSF